MRTTRYGLGLALAAILSAAPARAAGINLLTNGDFSQGNVGFQTDYAFRANAPTALWPDGTFGIVTRGDQDHPLWTQTLDQDGEGTFGAFNGLLEPSSVWRETISVIPGWWYTFSAFAVNLCCTVPQPEPNGAPELTLRINGADITAIPTDGPGRWVGTSIAIQATAKQLEIEIANTATWFTANDFGLSSLSLTHDAPTQVPTPEPMTLLMLGTGLALAGLRIRGARHTERG